MILELANSPVFHASTEALCLPALRGLEPVFHGFRLSVNGQGVTGAITCAHPKERNKRLVFTFYVSGRHLSLFDCSSAKWALRRVETILRLAAKRLAREVQMTA